MLSLNSVIYTHSTAITTCIKTQFAFILLIFILGIGPFQSLNLLVNPGDTIARVKARYIMKYNITYNGYIYFQYKGFELLDDHTLSDYDICDGMSVSLKLYEYIYSVC